MSAAAAGKVSPATADINEVLGWKLAGAWAWNGLAYTVGHAMWWTAACWLLPHLAGSSAFTFSSLSTLIFLLLLQSLVLWAHSKVLSASESPPVYLPALGLHGRGWLGVLVSRVLLRTRKLQDFINMATLLLCTALAAATTLFIYSPPTQPSSASTGAAGSTPSAWSFKAVYGITVGVVYSLQHLLSCRDVLTYPALHRHRAIQLRQQLPACVLPALRVSLTALVVTRAIGYPAPSWPALLAALLATMLCVWGWLAGHTALVVVMSEPLRLMERMPSAEQDPVRALLDVLGDNRPIVQELGLQELATLAQGHAAAQHAWRAGVWADDSGRLAWAPLAGFLSLELRDWAITVALSLPGVDKAAPELSVAGRVQWNVMALSTSTGTRVVTRAQDTAAWCVRTRMYRVGFCLRALAGLAAASRQEDRYGIVLLSSPALGDITLLLLSCVLVAQQYSKAASVAGAPSRVSSALRQLLAWVGPPPHPSLQQVEMLSHAVEDVARCCVGQLAAAFGPSLLAAVKSAQVQPPYGSSVELQSLLGSMIASRV